MTPNHSSSADRLFAGPRRVLLPSWATIATLILASLAFATPALGVADGYEPEVGLYAADHELDLAEAAVRIERQALAGEVEDVLSAEYGQIFAGVYIQHTPEWRLIAQFTRPGEVDLARALEGHPLLDYVDLTQVPRSLADLLNDVSEANSVLSEYNYGLDLDIPSGKVVLSFTASELAEVPAERLALLSSHVEHRIVHAHGTPNATQIYAGLALSTCTSGFTVKNSSGTRGVTTAEHCSNTLSYDGQSLPYQNGAYYGSWDVQWHTTPNLTDKNWAYDGKWDSTTPYYRIISGTKSRSSQVVGEYVCGYGKITKFRCGYIVSKNSQPSWIPSANPHWIRVDNSGKILGESGDSGGPWFSGNTAYGIHHGTYSDGDAVYMGINFVGDLGLTVLTSS